MKSSISNTSIVIVYNSIYNDYKSVNVHELLRGIPTLSLLHYITQQISKTTYSLGDPYLQRCILHETKRYLPKGVRKRVLDFMQKHEYITYIEVYGSILFMGLALQNFTSHEYDDEELSICQDEYEAVFKAMTYCNQRWTDEQIGNLNIADMGIYVISKFLLIDLPIVEFKVHKDFKAQLYKAICFFEFCEEDQEFSQHLASFCSNKKIENWDEYISRLFCFWEASLKSQYIKVDASNEQDILFFDQYIVNIQECNNLWEGHNALNYFRDHFLFRFTDDIYILLNANLLIDKFYQGMKFDFYQSMKGAYKTFPDFTSALGQKFSEPYLLYRLMQKIYPESCPEVTMFTGEELKQQDVVGEPDLYLRIGNTLYLFEYKDVTLGDKIKYSQNIDEIKQCICDKICKYGKKNKGAGQLLYNIKRIFEEGLMNELDSNVSCVSKVYPIILTTDRAFSATGVNALVIQEFSNMITQNPVEGEVLISVPIIMELDTMILCAKELHDGTIILSNVLDEYLLEIEKNRLTPFSAYVYDKYIKTKIPEQSEENFLFGNHLKRK